MMCSVLPISCQRMRGMTSWEDRRKKWKMRLRTKRKLKMLKRTVSRTSMPWKPKEKRRIELGRRSKPRWRRSTSKRRRMKRKKLPNPNRSLNAWRTHLRRRSKKEMITELRTSRSNWVSLLHRSTILTLQSKLLPRPLSLKRSRNLKASLSYHLMNFLERPPIRKLSTAFFLASMSMMAKIWFLASLHRLSLVRITRQTLGWAMKLRDSHDHIGLSAIQFQLFK